MPTQITQIDDDDRGVTIYRVEGEMFAEDVELISRLAVQQQSDSGNSIVIDIADLDFIDSNSAPLLRRLESEHGFEITGSEIFLQNIVNAAEKA
jgi:anti-anti-sigma regulatory factor